MDLTSHGWTLAVWTALLFTCGHTHQGVSSCNRECPYTPRSVPVQQGVFLHTKECPYTPGSVLMQQGKPFHTQECPCATRSVLKTPRSILTHQGVSLYSYSRVCLCSRECPCTPWSVLGCRGLSLCSRECTEQKGMSFHTKECVFTYWEVSVHAIAPASVFGMNG